jgi:N utilization substance protein A
MNKAEFFEAVKILESQRNIDPKDIFMAVEEALKVAYKNKHGESATVRVEIDPENKDIRIIEEITTEDGVVEKVTDVDEITSWIGAQKAKQIFKEKIRELEREHIYRTFKDKKGELVTGTVKQIFFGKFGGKSEGRHVFIDLGDAEAYLPPEEQVPGETYKRNQRVRAVVIGVEKENSGPPVRISRTHPSLIRRLFELEVPEIADGIVEIVSVAREPGYRTKIAVKSNDPNVDATGACVGPKGQRVKMIVKELGKEKIDVVPYDEDPAKFVANALSPAKVKKVIVDPAIDTAYVIVPDDQLSLAIGKEGQNARLAAKLTGLRIDIKSEKEAEEVERKTQEIKEKDEEVAELLKKLFEEGLPEEE